MVGSSHTIHSVYLYASGYYIVPVSMPGWVVEIVACLLATREYLGWYARIFGLVRARSWAGTRESLGWYARVFGLVRANLWGPWGSWGPWVPGPHGVAATSREREQRQSIVL